MTEKARIEEIDIIKALGILLMLLGHAGAPGTNWIYLFHMAVFVIASGYCFRSRYSESFRKGVLPFLWKRILQLWLPYAMWQSVFVLLNNWLLRINVYTSDPALFDYVRGSAMNISTILYPMSRTKMWNAVIRCLLFTNLTPLGGALWFFQLLFGVSISYCLIDYIVRKIIPGHAMLIQGILSVVLLFFGCRWKETELLLYLGRTASCYILFFLGCFLRQHAAAVQRIGRKGFLLGSVLSLGILLAADRISSGNPVSVFLILNQYPDPVFFLICSIAGWVLLYSAAVFLKRFPVRRFLTEIGKRTRSVIIFHFAAFRLVAALIVSVYQLPAFCMAAHTHLYGDRGFWWLAYTFAGLVLPLLISFGSRLAVRFLKKTFAKRTPPVSLPS